METKLLLLKIVKFPIECFVGVIGGVYL